MKVLIKLVTASELITYEAMSLAMTMATFDHQIQLYCSLDVFPTLLQTDNRIHGMLKSLDLYDIPPIIIEESITQTSKIEQPFFISMLSDDIKEQIAFETDSCQQISEASYLSQFDTVLTF